MVIMGPKPIPDEEPEPPKSQKFTTRWIKSFTQNFSSTNKMVGDGGVGTSSNHKRKGKQKVYFGSYEEQEQFYRGSINFKQIKDATQNFKYANKIGEGGFGPVYKGVLPDKTAIAVKRLSSNSKQGVQEFLNEVKAISTIRHPNLVKLLGHCAKKNQFLLVYEYMENRCLGKALFGPEPNLKGRLNWQIRLKICLGIAKGLAFLHDGHKFRIVHRDIKLSNVLLDGHLNPKISDFGLAKFDLGDVSHISTAVAGTIGYLDPEYCITGHVNEKTDVYAFGVVTLELMSGRRNTTSPSYSSAETIYLLHLAKVLRKKGKLLQLIDEDLKTSISVNEATTVLDLALLCTNQSPKLRPTMTEVVSILEGRTKMRSPHPLDSFSLEDEADDNLTSFYGDLGLDTTNTQREGREDGVTAFTSQVASKEQEDKTHSTCHGNCNSNTKDILGEGEEEWIAIFSSQVTSKEEEDNTLTIFHGDFVYDAKDPKGEGEEDGVAIISSHDASKEENNTHTACNVDFVPAVKDSMGEPSEDARMLTHKNVATSEPPILNARSWTSSTFMDVTMVEDEGDLKYVEPFFEEGKHHIECLDEEFEVGCNKWKDSLVGYFLGEKAPLNVDREVIERSWELKENVSVFSMGSGYFLFQFSCIQDKIRVLESSGLWHIEQRPLILRKWNWKLKFDKVDEMKSLPVWVKIYNLPLFLWTSPFLSKVGSGFGVPLYVDRETKNGGRLDYARLCIEVDASKPLPDSWNISVKGVDYKLNLEYEWGTLSCANCCTVGHTESNCRLKTKETKQS